MEVVDLRQYLGERFPRIRTAAEMEWTKPAYACWPTGLPCLDSLVQGGLPKGAITEAVSPHPGSGSAMLLQALVRRAHETRQFAGLIDGANSFDAAALEQPVLSRLLWVRCNNADQAMKAVDILLRDRNLPLLALDLKMNPASQLRKISGAVWYRLQRIVQQTTTAFLVITPWPMISSAEVRLTLNSRFTLNDLQADTPAQLDLSRWSFGEAQSVQAG
jgi:hypothetical protein